MDNLIKIKITVRSAYTPQHECSRKLLEFVRLQGYDIEQCIVCNDNSKNYVKTDRTWQAVSYHGEGEDIKNLLRSQGFADRDFKINVEYQRGWGFL